MYCEQHRFCTLLCSFPVFWEGTSRHLLPPASPPPLPWLLFFGAVVMMQSCYNAPHLLSPLALPLSQLQSCPTSQAPEHSATGSPSLKLRLKFQVLLHRLPPSMVRAAQVSSVAVPSQPDDKKAQEEEAAREARVVKEGALQQPLTDPCLPHSQSSTEHTPPSVLATLAKGFAHRERQAQEPVHKIRVDFKVSLSTLVVNTMHVMSTMFEL